MDDGRRERGTEYASEIVGSGKPNCDAHQDDGSHPSEEKAFDSTIGVADECCRRGCCCHGYFPQSLESAKGLYIQLYGMYES